MVCLRDEAFGVVVTRDHRLSIAYMDPPVDPRVKHEEEENWEVAEGKLRRSGRKTEKEDAR